MESSSHSQEMADSVTGVVHGSSTSIRTSHLPRKLATRMLASTLPSTTMSAIEIVVKMNVLPSDRQNTGSWKMARKFASPTKLYDGSPAVTSESAMPIAGEVLDAVHRQRHLDPVHIGRYGLDREQVLWAEPDEGTIAGNQVHRRRPDERGHERVGRVVVHLDRRSDLADRTGVEHGDPLPQPHRLDLVVRDVDGRGGDLLLEPLELVAGAGPQLGVQVGQWLVEQEHVRLADQGTGQGNPLALAAGQLARLARQERRDAEQLGGPVRLALPLRAVHAGSAEREHDVAQHRLMWIERVALEHHGDLPGARWQARHHVAVDEHVAAAGLLQPGDGAQQRGLAAPRRADEHQVLALGRCQVHVVDRPDLAPVEVLHQVAHLDDRQDWPPRRSGSAADA